MPPLQALAALHGFWMMVALAVVVQAFRRLDANQLRLFGRAAAATGVAGLIVFSSYDLLHWLSTVPAEFRRYIPQRLLFFIGTNTDVPLVPLTVAGVVCWIAGVKKSTREGLAPSSSQSGAGDGSFWPGGSH